MADFVQVSSVMGFAIPRLLFHVAVTLYFIKTTMCWALHFVGLVRFIIKKIAKT